MTHHKPLIFIGNDDGFNANGIKFLSKIAQEYGDIFVAAPVYPQSGKSSAITVENPLRPTLLSKTETTTIYKINGTPVDCAKLAFGRLMPRRPDLVLSGINHGFNSGNSAIYSGTMGVVFEGSFLNVPSVGFSYGDYSAEADFTPCEPFIRMILDRFAAGELPNDSCLNINIPLCEKIHGIKATIGAKGYWEKEFEERIDPSGKPYYWLTGKYHSTEPDNQLNDIYWLERGYASITPCIADQTDTSSLAAVNELIAE